MKKMNKMIGIMMCVVLAIGCLTGCGKASDDEILMSTVTSINNAKSYDMVTALTGKMKIEIAGESQEADMKMDMKTSRFAEPLKAKTVTTTEVAGTAQTSESYIVKENDSYIVYSKVQDKWTKMSLGNVEEAMKQAGIDDFTSQFSADVSKYKKLEDKKDGDKSYLAYSYTLSSEEIKDMLEGMSSSLTSIFDSTGVDSTAIMDSIVKSMGDITMTIWIDRESETIYRVETSLTDLMNKMFSSLLDAITKQATKNSDKKDKNTVDLTEALSNAKFTVSDMNMVFTYSNMDSATAFELPAEAANATEQSAAATTK